MRLLVVEDEVRIAEILRSALSRSGFAVDAVRLCGDARAALEVNPYDAVILDLGLPDGDGLGLLRDMRARGNAVPVLVLTARDAVEHRVAGLDTGADDYLIKPFHAEELQARILTGLRIIARHETLAHRVTALEEAASDVGSLKLRIPL